MCRMLLRSITIIEHHTKWIRSFVRTTFDFLISKLSASVSSSSKMMTLRLLVLWASTLEFTHAFRGHPALRYRETRWNQTISKRKRRRSTTRNRERSTRILIITIIIIIIFFLFCTWTGRWSGRSRVARSCNRNLVARRRRMVLLVKSNSCGTIIETGWSKFAFCTRHKLRTRIIRPTSFESSTHARLNSSIRFELLLDLNWISSLVRFALHPFWFAFVLKIFVFKTFTSCSSSSWIVIVQSIYFFWIRECPADLKCLWVFRQVAVICRPSPRIQRWIWPHSILRPLWIWISATTFKHFTSVCSNKCTRLPWSWPIRHNRCSPPRQPDPGHLQSPVRLPRFLFRNHWPPVWERRRFPPTLWTPAVRRYRICSRRKSELHRPPPMPNPSRASICTVRLEFERPPFTCRPTHLDPFPFPSIRC